jgi:hypothetical protein
MSSLTPSERIMNARRAAHLLHATVDPKKHTEAARAKALERFEREADPDGVLPIAERKRRAEHLKKAYFQGLALKSSKARRLRKVGADVEPT